MTTLVNGGGDTTPNEDLASETESDFSFSSDESSSKPEEFELPRKHKNFRGYLDEVASYIDNLFDLSIFIRGSSRRFRRDRAMARLQKDGPEKQAFDQFRNFVSNLVDVLCRDAATPVWLKDRVKSLVTLRRQQFYYQRAHAKHLAGNMPLPERTDRQVISASKPPIEPERTSESNSRQPSTPKPTPVPGALPISDGGTSMLSKASTVNLKDSPTGPKHVTATPSEIRLREDIFPDPPTEHPNKPFVCNQCFYPLPRETRNPKAWRYVCKFLSILMFREHLLTDLRPYSCTFETCQDPDHLFETRDEWLQHEMQHRQQWMCDADHDSGVPVLVFSTENEFREHLLQEHDNALPEAQENFLVTRAKQPSLFPFKKCLFCGTSDPDLTKIENLYEIAGTEYKHLKASYDLQKHIGVHLQNFSLIAFLETNEGNEPPAGEDDSNKPQDRSHLMSIDWDSDDDVVYNPEINREDLMHDVSDLESEVDWVNVPLLEPPEEDPLLQLFSKPALATIPQESSNSISCLPRSHFMVPYERNHFFVGRDPFFEELRDAFRTNSQPVSHHHGRIALFGLGGIGKTQIALEFVYRSQTSYNRIYWISAMTQESLIYGYEEIGKRANVPISPDSRPIAVVAQVFVWLKRTPNWLLVVDNLDDIDVLSPRNLDEPNIIHLLLPEPGPGQHTLITTRNPHTEYIPAQAKEVLLFKDADSVALLSSLSSIPIFPGSEEEKVVQQISKELGNLPLAISQAGAYIKQKSGGFAQYLESYTRNRSRMNSWIPKGPRSYPHSVATTWIMSLNNIRKSNSTAAHLFQLLAFFNPDGILIEFLKSGTEGMDNDLGRLVLNEFEFAEALLSFETVSLIKWDRQHHNILIHRLVQAVIKDEMSDTDLTTFRAMIVDICDQSFPKAWNKNNSSWALCRLYISQIMGPLVDPDVSETARSANVMDRVGFVSQRRWQDR